MESIFLNHKKRLFEHRLTKAENVSFSRWVAYWDAWSPIGLNYGPQIDNARNAVSECWSSAQTKGLHKCSDTINKAIKHCENESGRAEYRISTELESIRIRDPQEIEKLRKLLGEAKKSADTWVTRFNNWEEEYVKKK